MRDDFLSAVIYVTQKILEKVTINAKIISMFTKIRSRHSRHIKRILWVLAIIIIPSFVMWGGKSFLDEGETAIGEIGNRKLTRYEFENYRKMADTYLRLTSEYGKGKDTSRQLTTKAWEFALLLWKAEKEKIGVGDEEIVATIRNMPPFQSKETFDKELYFTYLKRQGMTPKDFETLLRTYLKIDKLTSRYVKVSIDDGEVKKLYRIAKQKAKIAYVFVPYDMFKEKISIADGEVEKFYNENKLSFREEPRVKIKYALIENDKDVKAISKRLPRIKDIEALKTYPSLKIRETDFIGINDPIGEIAWHPDINKIAFTLKKGEVSKLYQIYPVRDKSSNEVNGMHIVIQKLEEKEARIPQLSEVKDRVINSLKETKMREEAKRLCGRLLEKLNKERVKDLNKVADTAKLTVKETEHFAFYDPIPRIGANKKISKIVFSLKKDQVYPLPVLLTKGAYIIQLKDITQIDDKDFEEKKNTYALYLYQQRFALANLKFLADLEKEANLKIYIQP